MSNVGGYPGRSSNYVYGRDSDTSRQPGRVSQSSAAGGRKVDYLDSSSDDDHASRGRGFGGNNVRSSSGIGSQSGGMNSGGGHGSSNVHSNVSSNNNNNNNMDVLGQLNNASQWYLQGNTWGLGGRPIERPPKFVGANKSNSSSSSVLGPSVLDSSQVQFLQASRGVGTAGMGHVKVLRDVSIDSNNSTVLSVPAASKQPLLAEEAYSQADSGVLKVHYATNDTQVPLPFTVNSRGLYLRLPLPALRRRFAGVAGASTSLVEKQTFLGKGAYGVVHLGVMRGTSMSVRSRGNAAVRGGGCERVALKGAGQRLAKEGFGTTQLRETTLSAASNCTARVQQTFLEANPEVGYNTRGGHAVLAPSTRFVTTDTTSFLDKYLSQERTSTALTYLSQWPVVPQQLAVHGFTKSRLPILLPPRFGSGAEVSLAFRYYEHDLYGLAHAADVSPALAVDRIQAKFFIYQQLRSLTSLEVSETLHRDIKSTNILCDNAGNLHLGDFGLSRRRCRQLETLGYSTLVVTLWYRSPELQLGSEQYSSTADVWALGAVFSELLRCGSYLFVGAKTDMEQQQVVMETLGRPVREGDAQHAWPHFFQNFDVAKDIMVMPGSGLDNIFQVVSPQDEEEAYKEAVLRSSGDVVDEEVKIESVKEMHDNPGLHHADNNIDLIDNDENTTANDANTATAANTVINAPDNLMNDTSNTPVEAPVLPTHTLDVPATSNTATNTASTVSKPSDHNIRFPITPQCLDLLSKMLTYDPTKRPLASELLDHPYFAEYPPLISQQDYVRLYADKYSDQHFHESSFRGPNVKSKKNKK